MEKKFKVGIIGAGNIAHKAAYTVGRMEGFEMYGIASRSLEKAQQFAAECGCTKAYGSYAELIADPEVDMLYIATPHSHHHDVTMEALAAGKPCLVEKSFMANAREAGEVIALSHEKGVYVAEAIWTRYEPAVQIVRGLIDEGAIGDVKFIHANLCYPIGDGPRYVRPELCGGALLDLGVYAINFARMFHPGKIVKTSSVSVNSDTGVDMQNAFSFVFEDGVIASLQSSVWCACDIHGTIAGTNGYLVIDDINNPQKIGVYTYEHKLVREIAVPEQITGFEYQFQTAKECILAGKLEPEAMPHGEIMNIMEIMDGLRKEWGVVYPMD